MAKDKANRPRRPRAETPRGFRDWFGAEVEARAAMLGAITEVYRRYGFDPLETSGIETVEALGKFLPDVDRPNEGVFAFQDDDETWLALRYDLTAPLARVYAQHQQTLPTPYRRFAVGPVWRNEKPGPGRFRQFWQCDADTVGAASVAADAEICAMLADALEAAGISRGDYLVRINNRKVLDGVMEVAGLHDVSDPTRFSIERGIVVRAIDKLDRLGPDGVLALLGEGRKDDSGDFTRGANLSTQQIEIIMGFVDASRLVREELENGPPNPDLRIPSGMGFVVEDADRHSEGVGRLWNWAVLDHLMRLVGQSRSGEEGIRELGEIIDLLQAQGYGPDRIRLDPSVVRGLGYYTGPVYEAELTFEILDEKGRPRQFGSVAGGGRYDDLVKRFTGQLTPATGVSIGVDRLLAALAAKGRGPKEGGGPVVVCVMDRARMADYAAMTGALRAAGLRAETFLGGGKMAKQLAYADRRMSPVAVIAGEDEFARGVVQLKDMALGARLAAGIETNEEWKAQPAQLEVPRDRLVEAVEAMIARAGG
ncbi:histidine--tRNA ligase [Rubrimonas cliftonensis]|uniref:Histidine--tRNA ligase n=1 Tax=Rubrimonas cliftonensis TaxID=89524 RepID=A0A1H3X4D0_9RHOB|nr:histidine--tRNA ligase [Rubrimonas cliftonensis]SDZ94259.1 histidyl-tRNA synthetase [Rubrimonas cliftonensis]